VNHYVDTPPAEAPDTINATALSLAKRWNLICSNGQVICLRDNCGLEATLPSLLCVAHLATVKGRAR
jgi:hypothetical protein